VIGNRPDAIASGPTMPDPTTFKDAWAALDRYGLLPRLPKSAHSYLSQGRNGEIPDSPKELKNAENFIIGDITLALEAMSLEAKRMGYKPIIASASLEGETGAMARAMAEEIKSNELKKYDIVIMGGETTPVLPQEHGQGGRNQHYVAATMRALADYKKDFTMASLGTDGQDYTPGIGGAMIDKAAVTAAMERGLDIGAYLEAYNTQALFRKMGSALIETDATGTNVCDIIVYLLNK